ncbi:MAG: WG repeat-containing protein [Clostridia bacterium]|nr:WG repeat-containing protein [Clostridia bacterium]
MNKKLRFLICVVLSILVCSQSTAIVADAATARMVNPTSSKVLVNGVLTGFEAYTIDGNNYFKLRDLAKVVSGTAKQFNVTYDKDKEAINLISTTAYVEVGGELVAGNGQAKSAIPSVSSIYKDGSLIQLTAYNIGGNNFFKLRDLMQVFNIGVTWDAVTSTIGIDTALAYVAPPVVVPVITPGVGTWYTPKYQDAFATYTVISFSEGVFVGNAPVLGDSEFTRIAIYDASMKLIKQTDYTRSDNTTGGKFSDGLMSVTRSVYSDSEQLYGYCDTTGKEVIPCMYFEAGNFVNGAALVHQNVNGEPKTLVINKKNEVMLSWDDMYYGDLRPYAIYIDQEDPLTEDWLNGYGWYYDFDFKPITIEDRANTWDKYGYYDEWGTRYDLTRYNGDEKEAFLKKYGNLYGGIQYQGGGFFIVEPPTKYSADDWEAAMYDEPLVKGVVDKNNKVIVPMQTGDISVQITETSGIFSCNAGTYNGSGKLLIDKTKSNYGAADIGHDALWLSGDNNIWGLCTVDGKFILPLSSKPLAFINKAGYVSASGDWYVNPPEDNITFYTTANMQVQGDTTELKVIFAKATAYKNTAAYTQSDPYSKNQFNRAYANASSLLASPNPIWIDINSVKVCLSFFVD